MAFPTSLDDFTPKVDNTNDVMAQDINELQTALEALEAKVGINASAVVTSLDYLIKSASDPGHTHTAYALSGHNHAGVYEPANPNLLDTGDIGVTVAAYGHNHTGVYAPVLGADDNYVTDAEKTAIGTIGDKVAKSLFDAYSILYADTDNTPAALTIAASTIVGRKSTGGIVALSAEDVRTIINVADGATANAKANSTEVDTGTDDAKFITADAFAGANRGKRIIQVKIFDDATVVTTGDGKIIFMIPAELNGMNLVDVEAFVSTVSSSGTPTVQIRNVTDAVDMLSTRITIDASEFTSLTAATAPVIDTTKDDVATGDLIAIDVDGAGTGCKGLGVIMSFQTP